MSLILYVPQHVPSECLKAALCHIADLPYVLKRVDTQTHEVGQAIERIETMLQYLYKAPPFSLSSDAGLDERQPSSFTNPWEKCYLTKANSDEAASALLDRSDYGSSKRDAKLKLDYCRISAESGWRKGFSVSVCEYSSDQFSVGHKAITFNQEEGDSILISRVLAKFFGGRIVYDDCGMKDFEDADEVYAQGSFCPLMEKENPLEWRFRVINQIHNIPLLNMSCVPELPENYSVSDDFMKYLMKRQQYLDGLALNEKLLNSVKKPLNNAAKPTPRPEITRF